MDNIRSFEYKILGIDDVLNEWDQSENNNYVTIVKSTLLERTTLRIKYG